MGKWYSYTYQGILKQPTRRLRRSTTEVEKKLWQRIRQKQMNGCRFRRQFPLGSYIVDFYCVEKKLAIELDGSQHGDDEAQKSYDVKRTDYLNKQGVRVLRFWNNEVNENMDGVLMRILEVLEER